MDFGSLIVKSVVIIKQASSVKSDIKRLFFFIFDSCCLLMAIVMKKLKLKLKIASQRLIMDDNASSHDNSR